jgi:hypothetical protein
LWKLKACGCKVLKQACFQMLLFTGLRNRSWTQNEQIISVRIWC